jgi:D-erythro-7,8-dihydroneopterin triphosphate epimerase
MIIRIKNLRLRTILGINEWEREKKQDIIINIKAEFDGTLAAASDDIEDTVDYKAMKRRVINLVENSKCFLIERLITQIGEVILEDEKVLKVTIEIDKPHALRFADSVSIIHRVERKHE